MHSFSSSDPYSIERTQGLIYKPYLLALNKQTKKKKTWVIIIYRMVVWKNDQAKEREREGERQIPFSQNTVR